MIMDGETKVYSLSDSQDHNQTSKAGVGAHHCDCSSNNFSLIHSDELPIY